MKVYYDRRAPEYDDWYDGRGYWDGLERPGWDDELAELKRVLAALPPARTLDVACGTGYLTRWLSGEVVGLDLSERMLEIARERVPSAEFVHGDALALPFEPARFGRVVAAHFYGHLEQSDRRRFLDEARRVARELVVVDASQEHSPVAEETQERILDDGSRWEVYKRYFTAEALSAELGGGEVLYSGRWFVAVAA